MTDQRTVHAWSLDVLLGELAAVLAADRDERSGLTRALELLGAWLGGREVRLEQAEDPPVAARDGEARIPLIARGLQVGLLVVTPADRSAPRGDAERIAALPRIAPLLTLAVDRWRVGAALAAEADGRLAQLAAQERLTAGILDALPLGIHVVDRRYRVCAWNRERERGEQGIARDEALGRPVFDVLHRQPADVLRREFDTVFADGRLLQYEMESTVAGAVRRFRLSKIPMRLDPAGPVTHVITVGEDVTDQAAARERIGEAEKLAAIGRLAAGVMHEVNNPLATIAACGELLGETLGDAAREEGTGRLLRIIELEVERCKRIVRGLLDFARPGDATRAELEVNALARHALLLAAHHPRAARVRLVQALTDASPTVSGNADQLVQVLLALLMNAMDASPEGGAVTLTTRVATSADGATPMVHVTVADEGDGIAPSLQARLFEPFFTTKPPGEGTGLGLAIAWGLVHDHGGELAVTSDPASARGATFTVALPTSGGASDAGEREAA